MKPEEKLRVLEMKLKVKSAYKKVEDNNRDGPSLGKSRFSWIWGSGI